MRNEKTTLPKTIALLIVTALLFISNCPAASSVVMQSPAAAAAATTAAAAANDDSICGSVEKFSRTRRWQDLPGCLAYMNGADEDWNSNPQLVLAKPAYEEMKKRVEQYLKWLPAVTDLAHDYVKTMTRLDQSKSGEMDDADLAVRSAKDLQKTVAKVQSQSVPDDFLIPGSGEIKAATVGEIKTRLDSFLKQADQSKENAQAVDDAKWEPFTKFLKGDRLKYFNETYRIGTNVYGRGGKYLDAPEGFRHATVICTKTWSDRGIVEAWKVICYSFQGDRRPGGGRVKSGYGASAPASAYQ